MIRQEPSQAPAIKNILDRFEALGVTIPEPMAVGNYLARHPDLVDVMIEAAQAARTQVENDTQLSLEMYQDPEADDWYPTLYVRQSEYGEDIFAVIDKIGLAYESDLVGKSGWFLVTTDFCPPARV